MKFTLITGIFLFAFSAKSQTVNGHIHYAIEVTALDTSLEINQAVGLLQNSSMDIYLTQDKSRVDFHMGELYSTSVVMDYVDHKMLMLYSGVNGNLATENGIDDAGENEGPDSNAQVTFLSETKRILDYTCKKAILRLNGEETVYWYTDEIAISAKGQNVMNPNIPGFLMSFSKSSEGVLMEYEVALFEKDVIQPDEIFSMVVPEGFQVQR